MAAAAAVEHRQPSARPLIEAELEALPGHAGDDEAQASPGVEPPVQQV